MMLRRTLGLALAVALATPLIAHAALGDGLRSLGQGLGSGLQTLGSGLGTTTSTLTGGLTGTLGTLGGGLGSTLGSLSNGLNLTGEHLMHEYLTPVEGTSSFEVQMSYQGAARTVLFIRPDIQIEARAPAIVLLHYRWGTPEVIANLADAGRLAAEHGAWLIIPEAGGGEWQDDPDSYSSTDDVGFLAALIQAVVAEQPVDAKRIYMAGMSNGGFMTERFACERADLIAGAAIVAATLRKTVSASCAPSRGTPMAIMLGSNDPRISPYTNLGIGLLNGSDAFARFAALDHCDPAQTISNQLPDIADDGTVTTLFEARGCTNGTVRYYDIEGGGHTWPQGVYGAPTLLGKVAQDFNATDAIWDFFAPLHQP